MKIKEGSYYRTRGGSVVGPIKKREIGLPHSTYPFSFKHESYTEDGKVYVHQQKHPDDLVQEVTITDVPELKGSKERQSFYCPRATPSFCVVTLSRVGILSDVIGPFDTEQEAIDYAKKSFSAQHGWLVRPVSSLT